ncbi:MAG: hypothetical protein A2W05_05400 [Candidatus Schekmanbacteria bacterium RBG_16_38_10]|uniref:CBS domain-containing protein n=1 Tax=Candidatus Schekmanbacteria bacterium RBG_16_38_10 TaxID=1817879 RepID=A0A1F7S128_9BACT|nr:MAG: hypothetical protein A2W05_05400 [Candidatus Schekmanbacteria bacterium RBG_16_38_10]
MDKTKLRSLLISPDTTLKMAMQKLNETAEKILFVTDDNRRLLGTITDGDIRRGIISSVEFNDYVEKIMRKSFSSVLFNQVDKEEAIKYLMAEKKIEQIPVLDDEGIIIDVVLWTDIIRGQKPSEKKQDQSNSVVIMAGGKGTRLDPFTKILPKPLIPIGNKPVIELIMDSFYKYGFHKFIYTLNYKKEYIKLFLKENSFPYIIDWVEEDEFLGTAGSLSLLKDKVDDTFFIINCDSIINVNFEDILKWHKEHKAAITIIGCHNEFKIPFGVLELSHGRCSRILEKPVHDVIINTGIYVMEPHVISYIKQGEKVDMNQLIDLVAKKEKVTVYPIYSGWFDIGQWQEYRKSVEKLGALEDV